MVDAYLMIRPWNRLTQCARLRGDGEEANTSNNVGDVIEVRPASWSPWSTAKERTSFYFVKVTDIPTSVAQRVREKLLERREESETVSIPRAFGFSGGNVSHAAALTWLKNQFPAASANFDAYFNATTEQPEAEVLSISWANLRKRFWHKKLNRTATTEELES